MGKCVSKCRRCNDTIRGAYDAADPMETTLPFQCGRPMDICPKMEKTHPPPILSYAPCYDLTLTIDACTEHAVSGQGCWVIHASSLENLSPTMRATVLEATIRQDLAPEMWDIVLDTVTHPTLHPYTVAVLRDSVGDKFDKTVTLMRLWLDARMLTVEQSATMHTCLSPKE